jgi:hypothetical protein
MLLTGGTHAIVEIFRRAATYPCDFAAGLFVYLSKPSGSQLEGKDEMALEGLKRISRAARKSIPSIMLPKSDEGKTAAGVPDSKLGRLDDQVAYTLIKDFFKYSGEEAVAHAIDGNLHALTATIRDIFDNNKSEQANFEREVRLETEIGTPQSDEAENFKIQNVVDHLYTAASSEETFGAKELIEKLEKAYPKEWRLIHTLQFQGVSKEEVAKRAGVDLSAVIKAHSRARHKLRQWLSAIE